MSLSFANALKARRPVAWRLASGALWSTIGEAGSRALAFGAASVVARRLGVADFGAFGLIQSTLAMLATVAAFGLGQTTIRYVSAWRDTDPQRAAAVASLSLAFCGLAGLMAAGALYLAAPAIADALLRTPELASPLRLVAPIVLLTAVSGAMHGAIVGFEAFARLAKTVWAAGVASAVTMVAGVAYAGLEGALVGMAIGELVRAALMVGLARRIMGERGLAFPVGVGLGEARVLWRFSAPTVLAGLLTVTSAWTCQTIIARGGDGLAELGVYSAAQKWMTVVMLVPVAAAAAFGPVLGSLSGAGDLAGHRRTTTRQALVQLGLTGAPAAIIATAAPAAMGLFGPDFSGGAAVVVVMMVLGPVTVVQNLYWQALLSMERAWTWLALAGVSAGVAVGLTWAWRDGGALAMGQAMTIAAILTLAGSIASVRRAWRR